MAASTGTDSKPPVDQQWQSRAVLRLIEAGSIAECPFCGERVKFRARHRDQQVICNVYVDKVWNRVEQFHEHCYEEAGKPHGEAIFKPMRRKSRSAKPAETAEETADDSTDNTGGDTKNGSDGGGANGTGSDTDKSAKKADEK